MTFNKLMIIAFLFVFLFQFGGYLWRKKHPKFDIVYVAAEIGAGKSCYSAMISQKYIKRGLEKYKDKETQKYVKKGWKVYSNDFIDGAGKINVKQLETMCAPEYSMIILDETGLEMNSRQFAKTALTLIEYFKKSRHYKNRLMLISQTFGDTDKQIRELASRIYFIRPIFADTYPGLISMPVRVRGHLGVGLDGQPCMQYKIGRIGMPYLLPRYYKFFQSFSRVYRPEIEWVPWNVENLKK